MSDPSPTETGVRLPGYSGEGTPVPGAAADSSPPRDMYPPISRPGATMIGRGRPAAAVDWAVAHTDRWRLATHETAEVLARAGS